jgi:hypothetical protein
MIIATAPPPFEIRGGWEDPPPNPLGKAVMCWRLRMCSSPRWGRKKPRAARCAEGCQKCPDSHSDPGWCSDRTSNPGAWGQAEVQFLLCGEVIIRRYPQRLLEGFVNDSKTVLAHLCEGVLFVDILSTSESSTLPAAD